jgi:hypothetical protein
MPDPKRVALQIVIPNPGEWCYRVGAPYGEDLCDLWNEEHSRCGANFSSEEGDGGFRRPQSCKDAEAKA